MSAITSNEPIGTTARLGVLRLGAGRLGATPRNVDLRSGTGQYAWVRSDGEGGDVNDGRPAANASEAAGVLGWTTGRS